MIRKALPTDADFAAPLIYEAIGEIAHTLTGTADVDEAIRVMSEFFSAKANRLSYENAVVAEEDGESVGLALFYHGSQTDDLDRPFIERIKALTGKTHTIKKEARDDEFYLDTLVVRKEYRGRGIGKQLLHYFEEEACRRGHDRVALLADEENERAQKLYESMGYRSDGKIQIAGHTYDHKIKRVAVLI